MPEPPPPALPVRPTRTTGKLLGRDLPQTPVGSSKRYWGRSMRAIDALLADEDHAEFDRLLAHPRTTRKSAHEWLLAHGVKVSHGAVTRYRRAFDAETASLRNAARTASAIVRAADDAKGEQIPSAALSLVEQFVLHSLARRAGAGSKAQPKAKLLGEAVKVLSAAIDARKKLLTVIEQVQKARKSGAGRSPFEVAIRVRQMLGLPMPVISEKRRSTLSESDAAALAAAEAAPPPSQPK
jgi:hypothetical protein